MTRRKRFYDPDPRRRTKHRSRRRGPRRGIEPAGLKRYRLGLRRRTADPGYMASMRRGRRGGTYFAGPHKRRYDPNRFGRARAFARRHYGPKARKLESGINKYGTIIGGLLAAVAGLWLGLNSYTKAYGKDAAANYLTTITGGTFADGKTKRTPEIAKLFNMNDDLWGGGPLEYVKYKFMGLDINNNYIGSSWVIGFWAGLASYLAGPIAKMFTSKGQRFLHPISKIGKGALIMSAVGALALPGSPEAAGPSPVGIGSMNVGNVPYPRTQVSQAALV